MCSVVFILHTINISHINTFKMVSLTLSVSPELKSEMDEFPEMNWSEIARQAIKQRMGLLKKMDKMLANSRMTEEDAIEMGRLVNKGLAKRTG
jgi:predicted transcriptional regulator